MSSAKDCIITDQSVPQKANELLTKVVEEPNSWRVCNIKLAQDCLEKRAETIFEKIFSLIKWRSIIAHLFVSL